MYKPLLILATILISCGETVKKYTFKRVPSGIVLHDCVRPKIKNLKELTGVIVGHEEKEGCRFYGRSPIKVQGYDVTYLEADVYLDCGFFEKIPETAECTIVRGLVETGEIVEGYDPP